MSSEEKKGRLSEDDVGTAEETTNFEDRINATLDKILDDEDDELDDIVLIMRILEKQRKTLIILTKLLRLARIMVNSRKTMKKQ